MIGMAIYLGTLELNSKKFIPNFLRTIMFILGIYVMGFYWIPYTIKEFGGIPFPINQLIGLASVFVLKPHFYAFIILVYLFNRFNFSIRNFNSSLKNCTLALILTFLEFYTPQQFPAYIGHPWIVLAPYLGLAKIFGQPIFSFFSFWIALVMITYFKEKKFDYLGIVLFIAFMVLNFTFPLKWDEGSFIDGKTNTLRLAQANVGNFMKMDSEKGGVTSKVEVERRFIYLSTLYSSKSIDLIIWPETSFPKLLYSDQMKTSLDSVPKAFREILQGSETELFFGGYDYNKSNNSGSKVESEYNSAFLLGTNSLLKDVYHKNKLLPFGEGLPFGPLNKFIAPYLKDIMSFFAKGDRPILFKTKNDSYFTTAICYEILFSNFIRDYLNSFEISPDFIINLTNDSWYGITSEPYHHLELSHWRAMELNLPIVRMTNTGISSVLYPDGSESKRTGLFTQEILDITLKTPKVKTKTIFQKWGILTLLGLFIPIFGLALLLNRRRSH